MNKPIIDIQRSDLYLYIHKTAQKRTTYAFKTNKQIFKPPQQQRQHRKQHKQVNKSKH